MRRWIGMWAAMALGGVAGAQSNCESWLPTWGDSSFDNAQSLTTVDHDGPEGPMPPVLYARGTQSSTRFVMRWTNRRWEGVSGAPNGSTLLALDAPAGGLPAGRLLVSGSIGTQALMLSAWDGSVLQPVGSTAVSDYSSGATLRVLTTWDSDGLGPLQPWIIAAGTFTRFGGVNTLNIAAWDGNSWRALGPGLSGTLHAAASFDPDGSGPALPLLAVGDATGLVRVWNGSVWSALGASFNSQITSLVVHDPDGEGGVEPRLYASSRAATPAWARIGMWNGTAWVEAGANTPQNGPGRLASLDLDGPGPGQPVLVAVGSTGPSFPDSSLPGVAILGVNGWSLPYGSPVSSGLNGSVPSAAVIDLDGPDGPRGLELIVGGNSTGVGGLRGATYAGLGAWNGERWGPLGNEIVGGRVLELLWHDEDGAGPAAPTIYAAGKFQAAGGELADGLARWDGQRFVGLGRPTRNSSGTLRMISRLISFDADGAGPNPPVLTGISEFSPDRTIVRWVNGNWVPLGNGGSPSAVDCYAFDPDGPGPANRLLFTAESAGNNILYYRWTGTAWVNETAVNAFGSPYSFADSSESFPLAPTLYSITGGGVRVRVGTTWSLLGPSASISNSFYHARSRWWDEDGRGPKPPGLIIGSTYINNFPGAAAFDGSAWRQIGTGLNPIGTCRGLGLYDPDGQGPIPAQLFRGSDRANSDGIRRLADGLWVAMGQGISWPPPWGGNQPEHAVHAFLTYDPDGPGPTPAELWIAGGFDYAGGVEAKNFARWRFETLPPAFIEFPTDAVTCPGGTASIGVVAQGADTYTWMIKDAAAPGGWRTLTDGPLDIGGVTIAHITDAQSPAIGIRPMGDLGAHEFRVRLANACHTATSSPVRVRLCLADFNCSGGMPDDADVAAFFVAWNSGDSTADINASGGTPDDADVDAFFTRWQAGC